VRQGECIPVDPVVDGENKAAAAGLYGVEALQATDWRSRAIVASVKWRTSR
jgi:hypothetical protein